MAFVLLVIGAILVVSAIGNTQGSLATALEQDVPGYVHWAAAIAAIGALGMIPGMRVVSRWLLALVLVVLVLRNYTQILNGFSLAAGTAAPSPQASQSPPQQFAGIAPSGSGNTALASNGATQPQSLFASVASDVPLLADFGGLFG